MSETTTLAVGLAVFILNLSFGILWMVKSNQYINKNKFDQYPEFWKDFNLIYNLIKCICSIFIHALNQMTSIIFIIYWYQHENAYFILVICVIIFYRCLSSTLHFYQLYTFKYKNFRKYFFSLFLNFLFDFHFLNQYFYYI